MSLGIDLSNYGAQPNQAALSAVTNSMDVRHLTIACQFGATYQGWYDCAQNLGIPVIDAYAYEYSADRDWGDYTRRLLANMDGRPPRRVWLDLEDPNPPADFEAQLENAIQAVIAGGLAVGIYTSPGFWASVGNPQLGSRLPLWVANWTTPPELLDVEFGGWLRAQGHQYRGGTESYGLLFDLSMWGD